MKFNNSANIDWLIFDKAYMRPIKNNRTSHIIVHLKLLINILFSFFRKKTIGGYNGGLFYIDNSRHFEQAKYIIPNVSNALYHNNTSTIINGGVQINITDGIYSNYNKLIKYLPFFTKELIENKSIILKNEPAIVFNGILMYEHFLDYFKKNKIDYVVIFTDHSYKNRALLFAAKESNVSTIYIPHASINDIFPPLEMDTAFLEGEDMKLKYKMISDKWNFKLKTEIILAGNYRTNFHRNIYKDKSQKISLAIGVTFNTLDSKSKVEKVVKYLLANDLYNNYVFIIRPHPSIKENLNYNEKRISISKSNIENSVEFLNRINFLISGDSNIILEAALLNKYVFFINLSASFKDHYDFKNNKLCPFLNEISDLEEYMINNFKNYIFNSEMLSYYDSSYNQNYDGIKEISNYLNNLSIK